jgi:hypothetical protein
MFTSWKQKLTSVFHRINRIKNRFCKRTEQQQRRPTPAMHSTTLSFKYDVAMAHFNT